MDSGIAFDLSQDSRIWDALALLAVLPGWLLAACNPDRIREALAQSVPQFDNGQLLLQKCEVDHIRYKDDHWTGVYHLTTSRPADPTPLTTNLEGDIFPPGTLTPGSRQVDGDFGTESFRAVLPDLNLKLRIKGSEKVLVSLAFLTDPEQSRQYLMRSIRASAPQYQSLSIKASHPNVVRYKPGSRCTIVYRLEYEPEGPSARRLPERVVAKTYRGVKGKNAYDSMLALWHSPLGAKGSVNIAEPLAYDEQERVMIQAAIPEEQTLKNLLRAALQAQTPETMQSLETFLQKTARGLADLHGCGVDPGQTWGWEDEMAEIRERVDSLSVAYPVLAQSVKPLLDRLNQLAIVYPPNSAVSSHGSFRPSQVLIAQDQIGFIDFDSFCQSEPANDLALFLSTLMVNGLINYDFDEEQEDGTSSSKEVWDAEAREARFALVKSLRDKFLDAYEQQHPISRQRVALWEMVDILMLVLHYWIKVKPGELKEILSLLERLLPSNHFVEKVQQG